MSHYTSLKNSGFLSGTVSRRTFLKASTIGMGALAGTGLRSPACGNEASRGQARAKSTIVFFLCGGSSHIDMWDLKPNAPKEYRGEFNPVATSAPGVMLTEHLPMTAKLAHHLAVVNSVDATVNTNDHLAGYYYNLTGHVPDPTFLSQGNSRTPSPDDWPYMGSVVSYKGKKHAHLPSAITLPHKPDDNPRAGQFAARLGVEHEPLYLLGNHENPLDIKAPSLMLDGDVTADRVSSRYELLNSIDSARRNFDQFAAPSLWSKQQERAFSLLLSSKTTDAFDVSKEPQEVRDRYGKTINAMSLLMARRLVEVGVPFITVFWKRNPKVKNTCEYFGGWDTHGDNFNCLKNYLLPEFDQAYSALIEDLAQRNMLDETLVLINSEMGRTPKIGDKRSGGGRSGPRPLDPLSLECLRGRWNPGGQVYGSSDKLGEHPADKPVTPAHIVKTVFESMGIYDLEYIDRQNRPMSLLAEGQPIMDLF
ncbi:MAG: DUF1501 domain-containing protein [Planctomycetaceae bacterium]